MSVALEVQEAVQNLFIPHEQSDVNKYVTISIGISVMIPSPELSPEVLINQADQGLYRAKQLGRNQICLHQ
jgi:diguanylate cyclase (GGDEF)-like protein